MKKKTLYGLFSMMLVLMAIATQAQTAMNNFAGDWKLNDAKSDLANINGSIETDVKEIRIAQTPSSISITHGTASIMRTIVMNMDGRPSHQSVVTMLDDSPQNLKNLLELKINNSNSLTTTFKDKTYSYIKTYTLSENGQTISIAYEKTLGDLKLKGTLVYEKQ